jgi:hypothetical protein
MRVAIIIVALAVSVTSALAQSGSTSIQCVPPLKKCEEPVRLIADKGGCSCFACEYGKKTMHTGCTNDQHLSAELNKLQIDNPGDTFEITLTGTLKAGGDGYVFVTPKDGMSWDVMNPEAVKGHKGSRFLVRAIVHPSEDKIEITSLSPVKGG